MKQPINLFFSYSHKDEELRDELAIHLSSLRRQGIINDWHDRKISPGREWARRIDSHLKSADIVLALVSSDFISSDYCYDIELAHALRRHEMGESRVIPIILRPVLWKNTPIGRLQALPRDGRPVTLWDNRDAAFLDIAKGIYWVAREISEIDDSKPVIIPSGNIRTDTVAEDEAEYVVVLTATVDKINKGHVQAILEHLRNHSKDTELTLVRIEKGSVKLYLSGTRTGYERIRSLLDLGKLESVAGFTLNSIQLLRTLANFPHMFLPLTVIVGDRREDKPMTAGDLLALSASPAELRWILSLRLPPDTEIISDKVLRNADQKYIEGRFAKRNLLVIGSPATNYLVRAVNATAFFAFSVNPEVSKGVDTISMEIDDIWHNETHFTKYPLALRLKEKFQYYMKRIIDGGFVDPTFAPARALVSSPDTDYGVVSLSRNPFAPRSSTGFVSIMAGGQHLPATMHSIALLARASREFKNRPLGGVFGVQINSALNWEERFTSAVLRWHTEEYHVPNLRSALVEIKEGLTPSAGLSKDEIRDRIVFIDQLSESEAGILGASGDRFE